MSSPRLFRGKTKDGKWVEGNVVEFDGLTYILGRAIILSSQVTISGKDCGTSICGFFQVLPKSVGQNIGATDMFSEDVYGGMIMVSADGKRKYIVKYVETQARWYLHGLGETWAINRPNWDEYAITDNPELLETEQCLSQ